MQFILSKFTPNIHHTIFLKNPESSTLGRNILIQSVILIEEMGFEHFTFRKLSTRIQSTEASVYRYFENKYKLLLYLSSWYWGWIEYKLAFKNSNIADPVKRLMNALEILTAHDIDNNEGGLLDTQKLFNIIFAESSKAYLIKEVDVLNKEGVYYNYKQFVAKISDVILEISPGYKYPHMLTTTVIEGIHHQLFFSKHLKSLTDKIDGENSILQFYQNLIFDQLKINRKS
jgi:hypothetical protein